MIAAHTVSGSAGVCGCGGVDGPEAGGGQREKHLRTISDGGGHVVVAARGAGVHELPRVAGVEV